MSIIKKILVCTDFSGCSEPALEVAIDLALVHRAGLTLLHVHAATPFELPAGFVENMPSHLDRTYQSLDQRLAAQERKVRSSGVQRVDRRILQGAIVDEIVRFAEGFDFAVLGTHCRDGLERLVMGSVAQKVLDRAECCVVVVRPPRTATSLEG